MDSKSSKSAIKTNAAVVAGVGVAAGIAALQSASAKMSDAAPAESGAAQGLGVAGSVPVDAAVVQQAVAPAVAEQPIDQLVEAYLGDEAVAALNAEALSDAEVQGLLPEPEFLNAMTSQPGYDLAQSGPQTMTDVGGGGGGGFPWGYVAAGIGGAAVLNEVLGSDI
jgi:hypothetical protein